MAVVLINQGTQTAIANDTVGSVYYQTIKVDMGTAGVSNPFSGTLPAVSNLAAGTITRVEGGTITTNQTTGTITALLGGSVVVTGATVNTGTINAGTINRIGNVGTLEVGTITTLPNLPGGSVNVTAGTINTGTINVGTINVATVTGGTLTNLVSGTINAATAVVNSATISVLPNLPQGSINVTTGTIGGKAASAAIASGNPVFTAGTDPGGTIYGLRVDTAGVLQVNGTVATGGAGTQPTRIIDGTVTRLEGGTINRIMTIGTLEVGTVTLTAQIGTLNVGTINTGTINTGTITNLLKAEDAGHASGDLGVFMLGVRNDNGTALATTDLDYIPLQTDANGALRISGTVATGAGTQPVRLIDGTLTNLISGTINSATTVMTAGTITAGTFNAGTVVSRYGVPALQAGSYTANGQGNQVALVSSSNFGYTEVFFSVAGTHVGLNLGFEISDDNSIWIPTNVVRSDNLSFGTSSGVLTSNSSVAFHAPTRGAAYFKATSIAYTSGTANIRFQPISSAHDPLTTVGGTVSANIISGSLVQTTGTINAGTINVATITGGTLTNLVSGTINSATAVVNSATISVLPNLPQGSINVTAGTIATLGTMGTLGLVNTVTTVTTVSNVTNGSVNIPAGTITSVTNLAAGTITALANGTITTGTIGGKAASAAIASGNPVFTGGTDAGGTIYGFLTDTKGQQYLGGGTVGVVTTVSNITNGSIVVTAGTIAAHAITAATITEGTLRNLISGTINAATAVVNSATISVLPNLPQGSINVTAGTITSLLKAEDAAHSSGDLGVFMLGVRNDNGTALATTDLDYIPLQTDANGALRVGGSIVMTTGTVAAHAITAATITEGTLRNLISGTINSATAVLNSGTINVATAVITTLPNLPQGSINVTAGTVIVTAGTTRSDARTTQNILTFGTQIVGTAAIAATVVGSTPVGAGTSLWLQDVSIVNPYGSVLCVLGFGTAQQGTNVFYRGVLGTQTGVGIEKSYAKAVNAGMTNQDLVLSLGAAGTVDVSLSYIISA